MVTAFLAAIEGVGLKRAMQVTGVDRAAIQRLRAGTAGDVKGKTLERMRAYLEERKATSGEGTTAAWAPGRGPGDCSGDCD